MKWSPIPTTRGIQGSIRNICGIFLKLTYILYWRQWKRWSRSLELSENYDVNASAFSVRMTNTINNSRNILITLPTVNKPHRELLSRNWYAVLLMGVHICQLAKHGVMISCFRYRVLDLNKCGECYFSPGEGGTKVIQCTRFNCTLKAFFKDTFSSDILWSLPDVFHFAEYKR